MSLNIGLSSSGSAQDADYPGGLSLADEGCYWFLCPYFESVWRQTGLMIDLYEDAVFAPAQLPVLRAALTDALRALEDRPPAWDVRIGWRGDKELLRSVTRDGLSRVLTHFVSLIDRAIESRMCVVCFGD